MRMRKLTRTVAVGDLVQFEDHVPTCCRTDTEGARLGLGAEGHVVEVQKMRPRGGMRARVRWDSLSYTGAQRPIVFGWYYADDLRKQG